MIELDLKGIIELKQELDDLDFAIKVLVCEILTKGIVLE
jgi:hypothetical protein